MTNELMRRVYANILAGGLGCCALASASAARADGLWSWWHHPPKLELVAGAIGGSGTSDGPCINARFAYPLGIAVAADDTVYVADYYSNTIRKITTSCVVSTLAGSATEKGSRDGVGAAATFDGPTGLTIDPAGNLFVTDTHNDLVREITPAGVVTTVAGSVGLAASIDGVGTSAAFDFPQGIAADANGNLYVADTYADTIRRISPGGVVTTLAGAPGLIGAVDGSGADARFNEPTGVAVTPSGDVLVADSHNYTLRLMKPDGTTSTFAGLAGSPGSVEGSGADARLGYPTGMVVAADGTAYVVDSGNNTIRVVTSKGIVSTLAGSPGKKGSDDGIGPDASFNYPTGIALDRSGLLYLADSRNYVVRTITQTGLTLTLAGAAPDTGSTDGVGAAARFVSPAGIAIDAFGTTYVADSAANTIRRIDLAHRVTTLAGSATSTGSADGYGSEASFNSPQGVATDLLGNVYVADTFNDVIRVVSPFGFVRTLAGKALEPGVADGRRDQARFNHPVGLTVGRFGDVFVADGYNNTIRRISLSGQVSTVAGIAGVTGSDDGPAAHATFSYPMGVAEGLDGALYVADANNNVVRKIWHGVVSTLAGVAGTQGSNDGVGSSARFIYPSAIATDLLGNVYVCDMDNQLVRKITHDGVVSSYVGVPEKAGVELGALPGGLSYPAGIAIHLDQMRISTGNAVLSTRL